MNNKHMDRSRLSIKKQQHGRWSLPETGALWLLSTCLRPHAEHPLSLQELLPLLQTHVNLSFQCWIVKAFGNYPPSTYAFSQETMPTCAQEFAEFQSNDTMETTLSLMAENTVKISETKDRAVDLSKVCSI